MGQSKPKKQKVCFISSSGGHLEQLKQLKMVADKYDHYYVLPKNESTNKYNEKKYLVSDFSRGHKIAFCFGLIASSIEQLIVFIKEQPTVVVTTGARLALPTCMYAKLFKRKVVYIESFARMHSTNKTGNFMYKKADMFLVQWESLLEFYPDAIYGGWIY